MPSLLSGSLLNTSSPSGYAAGGQLQYQLGPTPTTSTGYTLVANAKSQVSYVSSLGNLQFSQGTVYNNIPNSNITLIGTGTGSVLILGSQVNNSTSTGVLVVEGGIGIAEGLYTGKDIYVHGIRIGQGNIVNQNNIVITSNNVEYTDGKPDGENNIAIGISALQGIQFAENSIALGRYAASQGLALVDTIAIGDSSLYSAGTKTKILVGNVTNIVINSTSTIVTVTNHGLSTGSSVTFGDVPPIVGTIRNSIFNNYLINVLSPNTFELFYEDDPALTTPVAFTGLTYTSGGTVSRVITNIDNIGIGTNAGYNLYDGQGNVIISNYEGTFTSVLTTGSFNIFLGNNVSWNMTHGDNNISLNAPTLVDGLSGQIGIGAVFYYNGSGYLELNADTGVGLGDDSTSTVTGAFNVYGGMGVSGSVYVGNNLNVTSSGTVTLSPVNTGTVIINPAKVGTMDSMVIGSITPENAKFLVVTATNVTVVNNITVGGNATVTNNLLVGNTGTFIGSVYSPDGNPQENYKLYTPKVTITSTGIPPNNPNVGDFWIDTTVGGELQWVQDGASGFWIQITTI